MWQYSRGHYRRSEPVSSCSYKGTYEALGRELGFTENSRPPQTHGDGRLLSSVSLR